MLADKQEEDRKIIVEYIDDIQKAETTGYVKKLCEERGIGSWPWKQGGWAKKFSFRR